MRGAEGGYRPSMSREKMPNPGTAAYDKKKARLRNELDNQGVPDKHADERANAILQGEIPAGLAHPESRGDKGLPKRSKGTRAS